MFPSPAIGGVHAQAAANGLASPDVPASGTDWAADVTTTTATVTEPTGGDTAPAPTATVTAGVEGGESGSTYLVESGSMAVISTQTVSGALESMASTTVTEMEGIMSSSSGFMEPTGSESATMTMTESETASASLALSTGAAVARVRGMGWGVVEGLLGVGVMALL